MTEGPYTWPKGVELGEEARALVYVLGRRGGITFAAILSHALAGLATGRGWKVQASP